MKTVDYDIEIVVLCNRLDFFLTKICIASIRYYYPDIPIYIIKDELNGKFSTSRMERTFNVQVMDLGLKKYGWCTGKISLLLAESLKGKKYLLLDSDIVFVGKVLDLFSSVKGSQFIVSPEYRKNSNSDWFKRTYFDEAWVLNEYPDYEFPGYSFNCGQMVVSSGIFTGLELSKYIDLAKFPYWTSLSASRLPCRDQSLLNILLPLKHKRKELSLTPIPFQLWAGETEKINTLELSKVTDTGYPFLIHWAGMLRVPDIKKMIRFDILLFFQRYYYSQFSFGAMRKIIFKISSSLANYYHRGLKSIKHK